MAKHCIHVARSGMRFFDRIYSAAWRSTISPSLSLDKADVVLLKPLAGGSSPRSMDLINFTRECFRAGTPGATTIVSEALGSPLALRKGVDWSVSWNPPAETS